ncbi:hypothetical protein EV360DRAFT_76038 [Lentinula raphanica]|nr:hypothetical protein EV360DRAFT_76038 [Lentinula raphanica]
MPTPRLSLKMMVLHPSTLYTVVGTVLSKLGRDTRLQTKGLQVRQNNVKKRRKLTGNLTGNMSTHVKKCWGEESFNAAKESTLDKAQTAIKAFGKKSQTQLTAALTTTKSWVKIHSTVPSKKETIRETVIWDTIKLYKKTKEKLGEELRMCEYKVTLALDCWTSPNHRACMSITVSINMATAVEKTLQEYGIQNKIIAITSNNASANTVMVDKLESLVPTLFLGKNAHVR